jgi:hypothetical protein
MAASGLLERAQFVRGGSVESSEEPVLGEAG